MVIYNFIFAHLSKNNMIIEQELIETREELFIALYENVFPKVAAFIHKMGGDFEEAKDVFQDALVVFYEKRFTADFSIESDEKAYLVGVCKNLWYKKHRENMLKKDSNTSAYINLTEEQEPIISESILYFVERSGKKCMELLKAFYYDKMNMQELADKFNFAGERSATAQKYKCLEKVRTAIHDKSLNKEDFYE